jgi:hypothetical protein
LAILLASEQPLPEGTPDDESGHSATSERIASIYQGRSRGLASLLDIRPAGDRAEIITPFLDPTNARISLFASVKGERIVLCDEGLGLRIVGMARRPDGESLLTQVLRDFGLSRHENHVRLECSEAELPAKQLQFCKALMNLMERLRTTPRY